MKSKQIVAVIFAASTLVAGALVATAAEPAKPATGSTPASSSNTATSSGAAKADNNKQAPEGWVLIREDTVVLTADEPQNHFIRAQQALNQKDLKLAAGELRVGAAYLEMQASRGNGQDEDSQLNQQAEHLRQEANAIIGDKSADVKKDDKDFSEDFRQADVVLARHLQELAKAELAKNKPVMAGHDLMCASDSLSAAYAWGNQQPAKDVSTDIQNAQEAAAELMTPVPQSSAKSTPGQAQPAGAKMTAQSGGGTVDPSRSIDQLGSALHEAQSTLLKDTNGKAQASAAGK
jgi:hypothetical protein